MHIIAFGASNSRQSINKKFATYVSSLFTNHTIEVLDLNDFALPIYSVDEEKITGIPDAVGRFVSKLTEADLIIISLAEYNGSYTAAFKNLFDWASRHTLKMFEGKKLLLLSTAPGPHGGKTILHAAVDRFPRHGAEVVGQFALPQFRENFDDEIGITNEELKEELISITRSILAMSSAS